METYCSHGLIDPKSGESLELQEVNVSCDVTHLTTLVESNFIYKNQLEKPIEASFTFPLAEVAVFSFEAKIDDRHIVAECRPKTEAQAVYDEAVTGGHTAFLIHQNEQSPDIFSMNVGRIPVSGVVSIKLKYVGHLEAQNISTDAFQGSEAIFTLPSVICPRYRLSENRIKHELDWDDPSTVWMKFPYKITFHANLCMPEAIHSVFSEKDHYSLDLDKTKPNVAKVILDSGFKPDHSLQMIIRMKRMLESFAMIEDGNPKKHSVLAQSCLMAQFMPDFSKVMDEQDVRSELIFIVDRSGSMEGSRIEQASESLMLFLSSLPPGVRFQIIGFGTEYNTLFPEPTDYNEITLAQAKQYQSSLDADMGGTEILNPLRAAFESPLTGQGWYKEIILLTDGDVYDADEVVGLVASNVHKARVFTIGIGSEASSYLIPAVARAGRGVHAFVRDETQLRAAVVKVLTAALQPRATVTELKWNLTKTDANGLELPVPVTTAPSLPPPIFTGSYSTMYAFFDEDPSVVSGEVTLRIQILDQEKMIRLPINKSTLILPSFENAAVHRLAGKSLLNELNDRYKALQMQNACKAENEADQAATEAEESDGLKTVRSRIEQLSCLINVISPYTSFVGVDPVKNEVLCGPRSNRGYSDSPDSCIMACDMAATESSCLFMDVECDDELFGCMIEATNDVNQPYSSVPCAPRLHCAPLNLEVAEATSGSPVAGRAGSPQMQLMKEPKAKAEPSALVKLLKHQDFSGFWPLNEDVAKSVELPLDALRKSKPGTWPTPSEKHLSENVWATLIVLTYLELKMNSSKDEWSLVARKAQNWLKNEAKQAGFQNAPVSSDSAIAALSAKAMELFGQ